MQFRRILNSSIVIFLALLAIRIESAEAQNEDRLDWHRAFTPSYLLLPLAIRNGYELRDFVSSKAFKNFRASHSEREAVDEIWFEALTITHGNFARAAFAATIASSEHETIPLSILGMRITIPFTSETHEAFESRRAILPSYVYLDSVADTDKLQHFFASAWLKDALGMHWLASLGGKLVEIVESLLVVGGVEDPRDIHADEDGVRFSEGEDEELQSLPQDYFSPNPVTTISR